MWPMTRQHTILLCSYHLLAELVVTLLFVLYIQVASIVSSSCPRPDSALALYELYFHVSFLPANNLSEE